MCSTGTNYTETATCHGSKNACTSKVDRPSCTYGSCSVSCPSLDSPSNPPESMTGTKTGTCTHKYYSTLDSSILCETGTSYTTSASCSLSPGCWIMEDNRYPFWSTHGDVYFDVCGIQCGPMCIQRFESTIWSCTDDHNPQKGKNTSTSTCYCFISA